MESLFFSTAIFALVLLAVCTGETVNGTEQGISSPTEIDLPAIIAMPSSESKIPMKGISVFGPSELSVRQAAAEPIIISASVFYIQSAASPAPIPPGSRYVWEIRKNSSAICRLRIQFDSFNIPAENMCKGDVLIIQSNGQAVSHCGLKNGQILYINFPEKQESVKLTFKDDGTGPPNPALQLLIQQEIQGCVGFVVTTNEIFYLQSRNFQTAPSYEPNLNQTYTIVRNHSTVCQLNLRFDTFELQEPTNSYCSSDYFQYTDNGINVRQCGTIRPGTERSVSWPQSESNFFFSFLTDGTISARGFSILVTQILGSC